KIAARIAPDFKIEDIFPFSSLLSKEIDAEQYSESFFHRPQLWIRERREKKLIVESDLKQHGMPFKEDDGNSFSISLPNATPLTKLLSYEKGFFEIQDWASQQTVKYIPVKP